MSSEPCVSGTVLLDARWAIEQLYGQDVIARVLGRVPDKTREIFEGATHLSWVPCEQVNQIYDAVAEEVGLSPRELRERVVPLSVERSLTTVWRVYLRLTSDKAFFERAPLLYARSRSVGTMSTRVIGPGSAEMLIRGWPRMPERDAFSLALGAATVLRLAGRRAVRVDHATMPDGARLTARWRV
ncbi:MAG: hypothetical protein MUF34_26960 [Polyangiaceae bacterium]|jgi:hypothetical protein|nr:hypothetical protein [Polyangiaceae bacterium]